ncbi:hypothetical protein BX600DRAFT_226430 [Xylariales sp. PMI_506]|nr:hypothetical protein BX600DRAFT_226430 [Xylariales sp. PMI_506]
MQQAFTSIDGSNPTRVLLAGPDFVFSTLELRERGVNQSAHGGLFIMSGPELHMTVPDIGSKIFNVINKEHQALADRPKSSLSPHHSLFSKGTDRTCFSRPLTPRSFQGVLLRKWGIDPFKWVDKAYELNLTRTNDCKGRKYDTHQSPNEKP